MKSFKTTRSSFWKSHLAAWRSSGLSQGEYCRVNGLKVSSFNHHKTRKFGLDDKPSEQKNLELVAVPTFTPPLSLIVSRVDASSGLSILLGNSATIKIAADYDSKCLGDLLRIISTL